MKFSKAALLAMVGGAAAKKDSPDERTFAVLHFNNKQLVKVRADPIVTPGIPGTHVHTVLGGSGFSLTSTGEDLMKSNCSTAKVKGDNSNYWVPLLYFRDPKTGILEDVELFYANVYYFFDNTHDDIKAFPVGLSILVGDPNLRLPPKDGASTNVDPSKGAVNPITWTCPRKNMDIPGWPEDSDGTMAGIGNKINKGEGVGFPDVDCDGYASPLRGDIHFPSCYNPAKGLTNYKENMVFPSENEGKLDCPKGYIHVPHLFFEIYWNTPAFADRWEQGKGKQPFVLANGDATGYSHHGDFMAGWDEDLLQNIIDHCNQGTSGMDTCPGLHGLNDADCEIPPPLDEKTTGKLDKLPGDNPITGWQYGLGSSSTASGASGLQNKMVQGTGNSQTQTQTQTGTEAKAQPQAQPKTSGAPTAGEHAAGKSAEVQDSKEPKAPAMDGHAASNTSRIAAGYQYAGCFKDSSMRALSGEIRPDLGPVSNEKCVKHCTSAGYDLAGTEYGGQCYCGHELVNSQKLDETACSAACEGDKHDVCGGGWALSVYSKNGKAALKTSKTRRHALQHLRSRSQRIW